MKGYILSILGSGTDYFYEAEHYPKEGDFTHAKETGSVPGGPCFNMACVCASRGGNVKAIDYLDPNDAGCRDIVATLEKCGVDTSDITYGECINQKVIIINTGDKRTMFVVDPVRPKYDVDEGFQQMMNESSYMYCLMHMMERNFVDMEPVRIAREHGAKMIFDGTSDYNGKGRAQMVLDYADGLFINSNDYANFRSAIGMEPKDALLSRGALFVVVTDGSNGATVYAADGVEYHTDSCKVDVTDSTGAGDSFAGTFLYGLQKGYDLQRCLRLASLGGAFACTRIGGIGGCCSEEELIAFGKEHGFEV